MAQKVQVLLTCDLDEDEVPAAATVTFGYDGYNYAFELCEAHLDEFNASMQQWVSVARLADGPRRRRAGAPPASPGRARRSATGGGSPSETGAIREWARSNGYEISDRGRIPAEVRRAYEEANG